jgi:adenosylcobinamide-GDP ribazoletransferase
VVVGVGVAIVTAFLALPAPMALAAVLLALGASLAMAKLTHVQVGGYTGDVLGAGEVVIECVVLTVATSIIGL